jgi:DNA-binding FadR family transcriptional regulator
MSMPAVNSLRLYQQVAATIERAIADGRYQPGQRLASERDLAEEFCVSRPTVRRAVIALEMRGLLEARQGSGVYVRQPSASKLAPTPKDLDIDAFDHAEARRLFEGEVAALAAMQMPEMARDVRRRPLKDEHEDIINSLRTRDPKAARGRRHSGLPLRMVHGRGEPGVRRKG